MGKQNAAYHTFFSTQNEFVAIPGKRRGEGSMGDAVDHDSIVFGRHTTENIRNEPSKIKI